MQEVWSSMKNMFSHNIEHQGWKQADDQYDKEGEIVLILHGASLKREHHRARQTSDEIHQEEIEKPHMSQAEQIAEGVFGKTGDKKHQEWYV